MGVWVCVCKKKPLPPFSCNQDVGSTTAPHSGFLVPQILDNFDQDYHESDNDEHDYDDDNNANIPACGVDKEVGELPNNVGERH